MEPLPISPDQGCDDFIAANGVKAFKELKRIPLKHPALNQFKSWWEGWIKGKYEEQRKRSAAGGKEPVSDEELEVQARSVIESADALKVYRAEYQRLGYGGDLGPIMIVTLSMTTRLIKMRRGAMPSHSGVIGPPSIGKSFTVQTALSVFPEEAFHVIDAGSPRVMIYDPADLKHRVLLFSESDSIPGGEDNPAASAIRNLCQDHYLHYTVTERDPETGQYTTRHIVKEGPTALITTAVRFLGGQLGTRLFLVEVPEDVKRLQEALAAQAKLEVETPADPSPALIAYQLLLQRKAPIDVIVPFAPVLSKEIGKSANAARILRDFQRIISLIKAAAILRFPYRESGEDGRLIATLDDYEVIFQLIADVYRTAVSEASKGVRELVEMVMAMEAAKDNEPITFSTMAKRLRIHPEQAKRRARRAVKQGWLINKEERKNHPAKLTSLGADSLPDSAGLPEASFLRDLCESVKQDSSTTPESTENDDNLTTSEVFTEPFTISQVQQVGCETVKDAVKASEVVENAEDLNLDSYSDNGSFTVSHPYRKMNGATFSEDLPSNLVDRFSDIKSLDTEFFAPPGCNPMLHGVGLCDFRSGEVRYVPREGFNNGRPLYGSNGISLILAFAGTQDLAGLLEAGKELPGNYIDVETLTKLAVNVPRLRKSPGLLEACGIFKVPHNLTIKEKKAAQKRYGKPVLTEEDHESIRIYCPGDAEYTAELFLKIPSLDVDRAIRFGEYSKECARIQFRGIPVDVPLFEKIQRNRKQIRLDLIRQSPVGSIYTEKGIRSIKNVEAWIKANGFQNWQLTDKSGKPCLQEDYLKKLCAALGDEYPEEAAVIRALIDLTAQLKDFQSPPFGVAPDGRTHADQRPFGAGSGRNAPKKYRLFVNSNG